MGSWSWSQVEASLGSDVSWEWGGVHRSAVGGGVGGAMMVDWSGNNVASISVVHWSSDNVVWCDGNVVWGGNVMGIRDGSWGVGVSVHCGPARVLGDWSVEGWGVSPGGVRPDG